MNRKFLSFVKFLIALGLLYLVTVGSVTAVSVMMIHGAMNNAFANATTESVQSGDYTYLVFDQPSLKEFYAQADTGISLFTAVKPFLCAIRVPDFSSIAVGSSSFSLFKSACDTVLSHTFDLESLRAHYLTSGSPVLPYNNYELAQGIGNWLVKRMATHGIFYIGIGLLVMASYFILNKRLR